MVEKKIPKILFVDDEENILKSLKRLFIDEEIEVLTANSGFNGLDIIKDNEISVVISDQKMPEMNGAEFLARVKEISPDSIRIILTGYADINAAMDAINKGGAFRYITKPWNDADLLLLIKDAIEKYRLIKENKYLTELTKKQNEELKKWNTQLEIMVQEQTIDIQNQNKKLKELNEQLKKNFRQSIEAFSSLIEMRDKSMSCHSKNVASISREVAKEMALSEDEINRITIASLLHDIGKIGIPDSILAKREEEWNEYERNEYRLHPVRGQVIIAQIEGFKEIGQIIRYHHENIDGTGFPDHLKKDAIPLGSRIISMADAIDRSANVNPLAKNNYQKALNEIELYLDKKYDRQIFPYLRYIISRKINEISAQDFSNEIEIHPSKLVPGMVISREIRSGSGILILAQGVILDKKIINAIQRYYEIDPPKTGIFVIREKKAA